MEEVGDELHELQLTSDEVDRFTTAFRDGQFREMLCDYAQEISDPANRKKYEEEIKLLEQERGNSIEFIHPTPFRAIKTSAAGKQKCFINICGNDKVGKPDFKRAVLEDGRRGQCCSLPLSLSPGRQNTDSKGNKYVTYDVIFHPDTLHMAAKNKRFMDMVDRTAIDEVQKAFQVILDKKKVREIKTKYKGTPQSCVIRKPIPGYEAKGPPGEADPLTFPYPDKPQTNPSESPPKTSSSFKIQPEKAKEPTKPNYTVKYRSVIDLQDFRCSRDSAQSPRPKEIVVTIDLPLLKAVGDTSLEVKEKSLRLESKRPAYRLELPLSYPVDEDNGEAKFDKQRRRLTVTLPVQPLRQALSTFDPDAPVNESRGVGEETSEVQEEESQSNKEETAKETGAEEPRTERQASAGEEVVTEERDQKRAEELVEEQQRTGEQEENCTKPERKGQGSEEQERGGEPPQHKPLEETQEKREVKEEIGQLHQKQDGHHEETKEDSCGCFDLTLKTDFPLEEETTAAAKRTEASSETEHQHMSTDGRHSLTAEEGEAKGTSTSEFTSTTTVKQSGIRDVTNTRSSRGLSAVSLEQEGKDAGEVDLPEERASQSPELDKKRPAATLREVDAHGNETVISDHRTSAGFLFQNKLLYELD